MVENSKQGLKSVHLKPVVIVTVSNLFRSRKVNALLVANKAAEKSEE